MSAAVQAIDISKLSESERLELIDVLWDSLDDPSQYAPLSSEQMTEIHRRMDDIEENPQQKLYSWDEIKTAIRVHLQ